MTPSIPSVLLVLVGVCGWFANGQSVGCGRQDSRYLPGLTSNNRIINGMRSKPHSWPWLLYFHLQRTEKPSDTARCGANLIRVSDTVEASDIAVTAAHCSRINIGGVETEIIMRSSYVRAGAHFLNNQSNFEQKRFLDKIVVNPDFIRTGLVNDVAILRLDRPIEFNEAIRPICLPQQNEPIPIGQQCYAAGWGRYDMYQPYWYPNHLLQTELPVHNASTCQTAWPIWYKEAAMICAGKLAEKTSGTCSGDSGGMLACRSSPSDPWVLRGTTSFGVNEICLSSTQPKVFARVGSYVNFITNTAKQLTRVR